MLEARRGGWWDANKIGMSSPPIETPDGWLMIYHGVKQNAAVVFTGSDSHYLIRINLNFALSEARNGYSVRMNLMSRKVM